MVADKPGTEAGEVHRGRREYGLQAGLGQPGAVGAAQMHHADRLRQRALDPGTTLIAGGTRRRRPARPVGGDGQLGCARIYGQSWMLIRAKARLTKPA